MAGRRGGSRSPGATSSSGPTPTGTSARSSSSRPAGGCRSSGTRSRTSRSSSCPGRLRLTLEDDDGVVGAGGARTGRPPTGVDRPHPPLRGDRAVRAHRGLDARARRRHPARGRLRARGDERTLTTANVMVRSGRFWRGDRRLSAGVPCRHTTAITGRRCMTGRRPRERSRDGATEVARRCTVP